MVRTSRLFQQEHDRYTHAIEEWLSEILVDVQKDNDAWVRTMDDKMLEEYYRLLPLSSSPSEAFSLFKSALSASMELLVRAANNYVCAWNRVNSYVNDLSQGKAPAPIVGYDRTGKYRVIDDYDAFQYLFGDAYHIETDRDHLLAAHENELPDAPCACDDKER